MDNRFLYEETVCILLSELDKTINDLTQSYDILVNDYTSQPLFSITSPKLALLKVVSDFNNYCVRNEMAHLCEKIHRIDSSTDSKHNFKNIDFYRTVNGKEIGYYVSMHEEYILDIEDAKAAGIEEFVVIVLKSNILDLPPNTSNYRNYVDKHRISNISLDEYFESQCPGEYEILQEYIGRFNYEAEIKLGLTVSPIPTKAALSEKWKKIKSEIQTYFYEDCLELFFDSDDIAYLKSNFIKNNLLQIINTNFADSFISSEWYYDLKMNSDTEMEQTAIVAGYLKSIEQLLFSMMLSRSNTLKFTLAPITGDKHKITYVPLSHDNKDKLLTMAGNLLTSIDINYTQKQKLDMVYVNSDIGKKVQEYLRDFFAHTRNGFLHKDNIYTRGQIIEIRKKTYGAYFLLGSAFKYGTFELID